MFKIQVSVKGKNTGERNMVIEMFSTLVMAMRDGELTPMEVATAAKTIALTASNTRKPKWNSVMMMVADYLGTRITCVNLGNVGVTANFEHDVDWVLVQHGMVFANFANI